MSMLEGITDVSHTYNKNVKSTERIAEQALMEQPSEHAGIYRRQPQTRNSHRAKRSRNSTIVIRINHLTLPAAW